MERFGTPGPKAFAFHDAITLHQRPEVRAAQSSREPVDGRQELVEDASRSEQTAEYRVPAQGILLAVVGLRTRRLGTSLLRERYDVHRLIFAAWRRA